MFILQTVIFAQQQPFVMPKGGAQPPAGAPQGNEGQPGGDGHQAVAVLTRNPHQATDMPPPGTTETVVRGTSRVTNTVALVQNVRRLAQLINIARTGATATQAVAMTGGRFGTRALPIAGGVLTAGEIGYDYYNVSQMPSTPQEVVNLALEGIELSPDQLAAGVTVQGIKNQVAELASRDLNNAENAEALRTFLMDNVGLDREHSNMLIDCIKQAPARRQEAMTEADTGLGCAIGGGLVALAVVGACMWWNPVGWGALAIAGAVCLGIGIAYGLSKLHDFVKDIPVIGHITGAVRSVGRAIGSAVGGAARAVGRFFSGLFG